MSDTASDSADVVVLPSLAERDPYLAGRDRVTEQLISYSLIDSFFKFTSEGKPYPFPEPDELLPHTPDATNSVLIAVSPNQKAIEIRSGAAAARVTDKVCQLGVTAAKAALAEGDLLDGIESAVNVIAAAITGP